MPITRRVITREEYKQVIKNKLFGEEYDNGFDELEKWVEQTWNYFDSEAVALNYFLSKILEQFIKSDIDCNVVLDFVYGMAEIAPFEIEEFSQNYLDDLLRHTLRDSNNSLEEELALIPVRHYG